MRQNHMSQSPEESIEDPTFGAPSIRAERKDAGADVGDAFHGLSLEPGAPPTQASLDAAQTWMPLEDDHQVRLAPQQGLYVDMDGGEENHELTPLASSLLLRRVQR